MAGGVCWPGIRHANLAAEISRGGTPHNSPPKVHIRAPKYLVTSAGVPAQWHWSLYVLVSFTGGRHDCVWALYEIRLGGGGGNESIVSCLVPPPVKPDRSFGVDVILFRGI